MTEDLVAKTTVKLGEFGFKIENLKFKIDQVERITLKLVEDDNDKQSAEESNNGDR